MENPNNNKRARSANISLDEKLLLINTASKYKHILENKQTNNITSQEKANVWIKIAEQFNITAPNGCLRSVECLKRFYDNEKKKVRKVAAEERKEINLTGGGPNVKVIKDPCHDLVLSILNEKTVYGLTNPFDADNTSTTLGSTYLPSDSDVILEFRDENYLNSSITNREVTVEQNMSSRRISLCTISSPTPSTSLENDLELPETNNSDTPKPTKRRLGKINSSRRRPATTVKALTSSNVAEQYDALLKKRLEVADLQKQKLQAEINAIEIEHKLKVKLLEKELELKEKF